MSQAPAPRPAVSAPKTPWAAVVKSAPKTPPQQKQTAGIDTQAASPAPATKTFADLIKGSTASEERADVAVKLPRKREDGVTKGGGGKGGGKGGKGGGGKKEEVEEHKVEEQVEESTDSKADSKAEGTTVWMMMG